MGIIQPSGQSKSDNFLFSITVGSILIESMISVTLGEGCEQVSVFVYICVCVAVKTAYSHIIALEGKDLEESCQDSLAICMTMNVSVEVFSR